MKRSKDSWLLSNIIMAVVFVVIFGWGTAADAFTSVSGTLTEPDGTTAVNGAWMYIRDSNWNVTQGIYTDSSGNFSFNDLSTNTYILEIYANNTSYPNPDNMEVGVTGGQTTDLGVVELMIPNIIGRTTLLDGTTAVPNVYVYMHDNNWNVSKSAYSDADGYFNLYTGQPGDYILEIWNSYSTGGIEYWPTQETAFTLEAGVNENLGNIIFNAPNVTGTVTLPNGTTPVQDVSITIRTSDWNFSRNTNTAADGTFGMYVAAGDYILELWTTNENYPAPDPSTFTVTAGQNKNLGVIRLVEPNVKGKVTRADGVTAVEYASVTLHNSNWSISKWANTNASGEFNFYLANTGSYTIEVWVYDTEESDPDYINFTFTAGQTSYYDGTNGSSVIKLQAPAMRGQVLNPDSSAASYASIYVHDASYNWEKSEWASAESDGGFMVDALPTGTYTVEVEAPWDSNGVTSPDPFTIALVKGTTNTDYVTTPIMLESARKTITGTVTKPDGTRITDANINAWKNEGSGWAQTYTDGSGNYSMLTGKGKWYLSVYPTWSGSGSPSWGWYGSPEVAEFTQANSVIESATVNFVVSPFNSILKGYLKNPDGTAPPQSDYASISVWSNEGGGNWADVDSTGYFEMNLPAGAFEVYIYSNNETYGAPNLTTITITEGEILNLGTIKFITKNEHITGKVTDSNGNALENQSVNTWKVMGSGWAWAETDSNGEFDLLVTPGAWIVDAYPSWTNWNSTDTGTAYVATQDPQKVVLTANETKTVNFQFAIADSTIKGTIQDAEGNVLSDMYAWAFANDANRASGGDYYSNLGGSVDAGVFTIKVPSGTWNLGVWLPWGADYSAVSLTPVTIGSGETVDDAVITVLPNDAVITGTMVDSDGNTVDVWGSVFADNGSGGSAWADIRDGTYTMNVAAGAWYVGFWVDWASGYLNQPPSDNKVVIAAEETVTFDLLLQKADSTIAGTTFDPDGNPMPNAWINADTSFGAHNSSGFDDWYGWNRGEISDQNGNFSINIPAGEYFVTAALPIDMGYINPEATKVIVDPYNPTDLSLQFKVADGTISGTVTLNGTANPAFIWGWSEKSGYSEYYSNDGSYTLPITKNDVWHIGAIYETTTAYYTSSEYLVDIDDSGIATQDIVLNPSSMTMPPSVTTTFNSSNSKIVELEDGTTISMPANSLSSTETSVTFTASPNAQVPTQSGAKPIGLGYDLEVRDASTGKLINSFNASVSIAIPYTDAQLEALGITEDDIAPMYYDETAGTWKNVENVVIDKDNNVITFTVDHFTSFAITTGKVTATTGVDAPVLTLNNPLDNSTVTSDSLLVTGTVSDPTATVTIQLNSVSLGDITVDSAGAFSATATGMVLGTNTITVDAIKGTNSADTITRTVTYTAAEEDSLTGATGIVLDIVTVPGFGGPQVRIFDNQGNLLESFFAYNENLRGEFKVITADLTGDGNKEIIVYPSAGFGPQIRIFNHRGTFIDDFFAFQQTFRGGIDVKAADIDGDGIADLITKPTMDGGANVRIYNYNSTTQGFDLLDWIMVYPDTFRGQVNWLVSDIDADGKAEIITVPSTFGGPNVRVFTYNTTDSNLELVDWFMAFADDFRGGVNIAVGNVYGDSNKEIVVAPAGMGGPNVRVYEYNSTTTKFSLVDWFMAFQTSYKDGVNLKLVDMNNDSLADIVTTANNGSTNVRVFYNSSSTEFTLLDWFWAYAEDFRGGLDVYISNVDGDTYKEIVTAPKSLGGPNVRVYEYNAVTGQIELLDWVMAYADTFRGQFQIKVADLEGDGDSELIASPITEGGPNVRIIDFTSGNLAVDNWFMAYDEAFRGGVKVTTGK